MTKVKCDNCQWTGDSSELTEDGIEDLDQRLDPGSVVPCLDGECPECGCLTYLVKGDTPTANKPTAEDLAAMLNELHQHCADTIPYFPNDGEEASLSRRVDEMLDAFGGPS